MGTLGTSGTVYFKCHSINMLAFVKGLRLPGGLYNSCTLAEKAETLGDETPIHQHVADLLSSKNSLISHPSNIER